MPKGEIVGIKLLFPLVTTLSFISTATKHSSVNQVVAVSTKWLQAMWSLAMFTESHSVYQEF